MTARRAPHAATRGTSCVDKEQMARATKKEVPY